MTTVAEGELRVTADTSTLGREIDSKVSGVIKQAEKNAPPLDVKTDPKSVTGVKTLTNEIEKLGSKSPLASKALNVMSTEAGTLGESAGALAGPVTAAVTAIGATYTVALKTATAFADYAGEVKKVRNITGETAEEASRSVAVFKALGVDVDTGAKSYGFLAKSVEANQEKLAGLGVQVAKNADGSINLEGTIQAVNKAYRDQTDPVKKAEIGATAYGRGYQSLIPVLKASGDQIKEINKAAADHHQIYTQDDLDKATKFKYAQRELSETFAGLNREVGELTIGPLTSLFTAVGEGVTTLDKLNQHLPIISTLADSFKEMTGLAGADIWSAFTHGTDKAKTAEEQKSQADAQMAETTDTATEAQKAGTKAAQDQAKAIDDLYRAQLGTISADIKVEDSQRKVEKARKDQLEAIKAAIDAHGKDAEANQKVDDATRSLRDAILDQAAAAVEQTKQHEAARGATLDSAAANDIYKSKLLEVAATLGPNDPLRKQLTDYAGQLRNLPADVVTQLKLNADEQQAEQTFRQLERDFANRTITVPMTAIPAAGGGVKARALGGPFNAGDTLLVGEERPELVVFDRPGTVIPQVPSAGAQITVHAPITIEGNADAATVQALQDLVDVRLASVLTNVVSRAAAGTGTRR